MKNSKTEIFEKMPVLKALLIMGVPTIISQLITMIYNLADNALKASKQEELVFQFTGSLSPCVIRPKDNDDFTYLVLPVRFKND